MDKYKVGKKISSGAFGVVYQAQALQGQLKGKSIAIKQVFKSEIVERQLEILKGLKPHPNIFRCYEIIQENPFQKNIVMQKGLYDLETLMESWEYPVSENKIRIIAKSILKGLKHLHSLQIIHRDLKPSNIVVKQSRQEIIICDFGSAIKVAHGKQYAIEGFTRWYKCPQMLFGSRSYGYEADIWSLGCILMELATGQPLFGGKSELEQISLIADLLGDPSPKNWPSITKLHDFGKIQFVAKQPKEKERICKQYKISQQFYSFVMKMIQYEGRASAQELLSHSFLIGDSPIIEIGIFGLEKFPSKTFK